MPQFNPHAKRAAREFPVVVERGPTGLKGTAKIYLTPVVVKGQRYDSYTVIYYNLKKRCRERFNDYAKAFSYAERKAIHISGGEMAAVSLKNEDQRIYGAAIKSLKPLKVELDFAIREYIAARKILGDVTVLDAAKFFEKHGKTIKKQAPLADILRDMLEGLKSDGRSDYHMRDVRRRVNAFIAKHPLDIKDITTSHIDQWLRSLKVGGRTRNNYRDSVHHFFNYARNEGYLPDDKSTAAEKAKRIKNPGGDNVVFTVEEMSKMLTDAPDWLIPTLALKFFSGLRTEEMIRLRWEDIKFEQDVIFMTKKITKTKQRRIVPLLPNLKLWLSPHKQTSGLISARWSSAQTLAKAWRKRAKDVGVEYKKNGMRNSYISYRIAAVKNVAQVALECGNSPGVIQREYLELVTEAEATKWFAIVPAQV
jgi:integrase